jgi:hypothetical protein
VQPASLLTHGAPTSVEDRTETDGPTGASRRRDR